MNQKILNNEKCISDTIELMIYYKDKIEAAN